MWCACVHVERVGDVSVSVWLLNYSLIFMFSLFSIAIIGNGERCVRVKRKDDHLSREPIMGGGACERSVLHTGNIRQAQNAP